MIHALLAAMVVTCMPMPRRPPLPPPPQAVTVRCEGVDQVRRDRHGVEVGRVPNACPVKLGLSARG